MELLAVAVLSLTELVLMLSSLATFFSNVFEVFVDISYKSRLVIDHLYRIQFFRVFFKYSISGRLPP